MSLRSSLVSLRGLTVTEVEGISTMVPRLHHPSSVASATSFIVKHNVNVVPMVL
jgi:hypothetical protein